MKKVKFYKKENNWYADVPEHEEYQNRMVAGSDKILDSISKDKKTVTLKVYSVKPKEKSIKFRRIFHDKWGGTYAVSRVSGVLSTPFRFCWLCNVTHTVLGEHPKVFYVTL